MNDAGCYPICASRIIFDEEPISVFCDLSIDQNSHIDTKANLYLKYSDMKSAYMAIGYDLSYQSIYRLWGTNGILSLKRGYNISPDMNAEITIVSNKTNIISIKHVDHFLLMIDYFSKVLTKKITPNFNFEEDLLKQAQVMEAARKSFQTKKSIKINEIK